MRSEEVLECFWARVSPLWDFRELMNLNDVNRNQGFVVSCNLFAPIDGRLCVSVVGRHTIDQQMVSNLSWWERSWYRGRGDDCSVEIFVFDVLICHDNFLSCACVNG